VLSLDFNQGLQITKAPQLAQEEQFPIWLTHAGLKRITNVVVPVRASDESSASRAANGKTNGGFSAGATTRESQQVADEHLLSTLVVELTRQNVHTTLLFYPRHVLDAEYCADKLHWLLARYHVNRSTFLDVHRSQLNRSLEHAAPKIQYSHIGVEFKK
jgi:hypothetical protein